MIYILARAACIFLHPGMGRHKLRNRTFEMAIWILNEANRMYTRTQVITFTDWALVFPIGPLVSGLFLFLYFILGGKTILKKIFV